MSRRAGLYFATGCALAAVALSGCSGRPRAAQNSAMRDAKERLEAPDFKLKDADGRTVRLSDYRGKVVMLNFWATTCGPCRIEIPWLTDIERRKKDQGFEVLGVSLDENGWEDVKPFLSAMKVNYRVLMGDGTVLHAYGGIEAIPTTFLIDKQGKIATEHVGLAHADDFEEFVQRLLLEG